MVDRILIIVSCNFAYWQYEDGTRSRIRDWNTCDERAVTVQEETAERIELRRKRYLRTIRRILLKGAAPPPDPRPKCRPGPMHMGERLAGVCK